MNSPRRPDRLLERAGDACAQIVGNGMRALPPPGTARGAATPVAAPLLVPHPTSVASHALGEVSDCVPTVGRNTDSASGVSRSPDRATQKCGIGPRHIARICSEKSASRATGVSCGSEG